MNLRHTAPALLLLSALLAPASPVRADTNTATTTAPNADASGTVALLPLLGSGLALDELSGVDGVIQAEVDARYGARSLPAAVVRERLEEGAKRGLRCDRSLESCQAQLGIICDADLVVIASLAPSTGAATGSGFSLSLRMVDVAEASQLAHAATSTPSVPSAADVRALLGRLDDQAARKALLVVTGPSGAPVIVDGVARGSLPLPQPIELAGGRHEVVVHTLPLHTEVVTLRRGERIEVRAPTTAVAAPAVAAAGASPAADAPDDMPPPPPPRLLAFAGGGTLAAVGAVACVVGLMPWVFYDDARLQLVEIEGRVGGNRDELARRKDDIEGLRADYEENLQAWTTWGQVTLATGAAALVVGGAIVAVGALALE